MTLAAELQTIRERIENVSEMSYQSEIFEVIDNIAPRLLDAVEAALDAIKEVHEEAGWDREVNRDERTANIKEAAADWIMRAITTALEKP